jgi:membrane protein
MKSQMGWWHDNGMNWTERISSMLSWARETWHDTKRFPWKNTAITLYERFREDRLGLTASSLTFTTLISLVPLFTVALAIFGALPMFDQLQVTLQRWLVSSMVPESIAKPVMVNLNLFVSKASQMGLAGGVFFVVTALALILTIDRKLNDIWRVRRPRGVTQRVLVYWAVLTLGPLVLALSLTLTAYAMGDQRALIKGLSVGTRVWLEALEWVLVVGGIAALYRYVPNTHVRWSHALLGGLFVAIGFDAAKALLGWYFASIPTYALVYGAFAAVPILLIWVYVAWVIVLLGAVIAAYLPSLLSGIARRGDTPGWDFQLAIEVLGQLHAVQHGPEKGLTSEALANRLKVSPLQLEEALATLSSLDWVGSLKEDDERYVLLVSPKQTPLRPLIDRLLLSPSSNTRLFSNVSGWASLSLGQVLSHVHLD